MFGPLVLGIAAAQASAPAVANPGQPLADRIEVAFRACAQQLTQRDHLTAKNNALLNGVGITLSDAPPAEVGLVANRLFGTQGIYASVMAPAGTVWIATSATLPACKVVVGDTPLSLSARGAWFNKLRSTSGWMVDPARSLSSGEFMRDFLVLNPARPGVHMVVMLDGPNVIMKDGQGTQLIMTVAIDTIKAP